jgi:hypothetical protein
MKYTTKKCMQCGESSELDLDYESFLKWKKGAYVQDAFPNMPAQVREQLISGTHPDCWTKMWAAVEDEDGFEEVEMAPKGFKGLIDAFDLAESKKVAFELTYDELDEGEWYCDGDDHVFRGTAQEVDKHILNQNLDLIAQIKCWGRIKKGSEAEKLFDKAKVQAIAEEEENI